MCVYWDSDATTNTVFENDTVDTVIDGLHLIAVDEGGEPLQSGVIWNITPTDVFAINSATGVVRLAQAGLDYEQQRQYQIEVSGVGSSRGVSLTGHLTVTIEVGDTFDSVRILDRLAGETKYLLETATTNTVVNGLDLRATDNDGNAVAGAQWSLLRNPNGIFMIEATSGVVRLAKATLDYERVRFYTIEARVNVLAGNLQVSDSLEIVVAISDVLEEVLIRDTIMLLIVLQKIQSPVQRCRICVYKRPMAKATMCYREWNGLYTMMPMACS